MTARDCQGDKTENCNVVNWNFVNLSGNFGVISIGERFAAGHYMMSRMTASGPTAEPDGGVLGRFYVAGGGSYGSANEANYASNSMKILYASNTFSGFSFAVSYDPNTGNSGLASTTNGQATSVSSGKWSSFNDVLSVFGKYTIEMDGIDITNDVIEYLAYSITTNIRELEGALISLLAQASLNKKEISIALAREMIDRFVKNTTREVSIDYIQKVVCDYFELSIDTLKSKTRKRNIVQARQLAMYFSKQLTKSSLANIGARCGGKDHATVLHACKTVNNLVDTDKDFRLYVQELEKKFTLP